MSFAMSTESLFFQLQKQSPLTKKTCPGIIIPDTVIFRWAQVYFWYFTQNGVIYRKTNENVTQAIIEQALLQSAGDLDIVATYMQKIEQPVDIFKIQEDYQQHDEILFHYLNRQEFLQFMRQGQRGLESILQIHVEPRNDFNQMMKITWSPQFCLMNRKTNINSLKHSKMTAQEKLCTYDGPEYMCKTDAFLSSSLSKDIQQSCLSIVKHVNDVTLGAIQIIRMNLFFKLNKECEIVLLFCSGIRIKKIKECDQTDELKKQFPSQRMLSPLFKLNLKNKEIDSSQLFARRKINMYNGIIEHLGGVQQDICANCESNCTFVIVARAEKFYDLNFGQIIQKFEIGYKDIESILIGKKIAVQQREQQLELNLLRLSKDNMLESEENQNENYNIDSLKIPGLILKQWGKIDLKRYIILKQNSSWLQVTTKLCQNCFLEYTQDDHLVKEVVRLEKQARLKKILAKKHQKELQLKSILLRPNMLKKMKQHMSPMSSSFSQDQFIPGTRQASLKIKHQNPPLNRTREAEYFEYFGTPRYIREASELVDEYSPLIDVGKNILKKKIIQLKPLQKSQSPRTNLEKVYLNKGLLVQNKFYLKNPFHSRSSRTNTSNSNQKMFQFIIYQ